MIATPRSWIVLDVETRGAIRPEDTDHEVSRDWQPNPKWKDEIIGKRFKEALAKAHERAALLDSAEAVIIAAASDQEPPVVFHGLGASPIQSLDGAMAVGFPDTREMRVNFRAWLDGRTNESTTLVGHNVRFDLNRLRLDFARAKVRPPKVLSDPGQPTLCLMRLFCRNFSLSGRQMIGLADVCESLGIDHHKDLVNGAQVGQLIADGKIDTLIRYAALDVAIEARLLQALTGQHEDGVI